MSSLYRGPSKNASYQISIHLAKWFQRRRFFRNQPIRNKNCLWWPCLLMDRDKMSNLQRGPSIDASYQVSLHLAEGFQRRRLKCEKLTDDRRRTPSDGKSSCCLWQVELKRGEASNHIVKQLIINISVFNLGHSDISINDFSYTMLFISVGRIKLRMFTYTSQCLRFFPMSWQKICLIFHSSLR